MQGKTSKQNELLLLVKSFRDSFVLFKDQDPLRMAGATAFFTTFALPPIIFILAQLFGLFIGRRNMGRGLLEHISNTLGEDGAGQVRQVLRSIRGFNDDWYMIVFGFLFLLFIATTLFTVIKNSLNQVWQVRVNKTTSWLFGLVARAKSLAIIVLAGILFFADLLFESIEVIASNYADEWWKGSGFYFKGIFANIGSVVIVSAWFLILFRYLGDARPSWKASLAGGVLTGILFIAGRWLLKYLLITSKLGQVYGASGSLVLLLLFVFYSSFILYYGACFITVYSEKKKWPVKPNARAYHYRIERK